MSQASLRQAFRTICLTRLTEISARGQRSDRDQGNATDAERERVRNLSNFAFETRALAADNRKMVEAAYGTAAVTAAENFFAIAEARAKSYGDVLTDMLHGADKEPSAGGKAKKTKETTIKDTTIEDELKAAKKFQADLTEMTLKGERERQAPIKQTTKEVWEEMQERLRDENRYESDGALSAKAGADARAQIYAEYSRKLKRIAEQDAAGMKKDTAKKQEELLKKGMQDAKDLKEEYKAAAISIGGSIEQIFGTIIDKVTSIEIQAYQDAESAVSSLGDMIDSLSTATVDAAALSGNALEDAYKTGKVTAEDLTDVQKDELSKRLKAEEKAAQKSAEEHKKSAMLAWGISQAAAMASAAVNTYLAISAALASGPPPGNIIAAAVSGAAGLAEEVSIASASPPSFRGGGVGTDAAPVAPATLPDVRMIAAELGESINNRRGTQNLGGEEGVKRNNAGMPLAPHVTNLMIRHEVVDRFISELAGRPSATRQILGRSPPRTNPYTVRR